MIFLGLIAQVGAMTTQVQMPCSNLPCRRSGNDNPDPRCSVGDVKSVSSGNLSDHDGMGYDAKYQVLIS